MQALLSDVNSNNLGQGFFGEVSSNGCRPPVTAGVSWWSAMIGGCRAQQSEQTSMEWLNRLREANSQWEGNPVGNGPRKEWIFKSISTNWQWHKFIFIGGSSMPWWNWEVIQRNGLKVIKRLVENRQTSKGLGLCLFFCQYRYLSLLRVRRLTSQGLTKSQTSVR